MANQSFRDILSQFLEEESEISPRKSAAKTEFRASFTPETPSFHWQNPKPQATPKGKYTSSSVRPNEQELPPVKVTPAAPPSSQEPKWQISELNDADQQQIKSLVQLGAKEINGDISLSILKKAYRRLARAFHPDMATNAKAGSSRPSQQESFLQLQSIYERLSRSLKARTASASVCGNGSASAAESRRQDAA